MGAGALPSEGGVVSSSYVGAFSSEGGAISSSYAQEERGSTVAAREVGSIAKGSIIGGAWNITTCCGGVGEHCCIQECYYEQSKAMRGTTLQEEQSEATARAVL